MHISIKKQVEKIGISRYELAKRIGVSYPTITSIYNGDSTSIKFEILEKLCIELNCTPNDIIASDDPKLNRLMAYTRLLLEKYNNKSDTK